MMVPDHSHELIDSAADPPQPEQACTNDEFVAALRRLRLWSGLTYRQVEAKAAAAGVILPSSTIASALGRPTLPREQVVDALTRACGLSDCDVQRWLAARRRLAMAKDGSPVPGRPETLVELVDAGSLSPSTRSGSGSRPPQPTGRLRRRWVSGIRAQVRLLVGALLLVGLGIGGQMLWSGVTGSPASKPASSTSTPGALVPGLVLGDAGSWARIRSSAAPDLCLTEGRDRSGSYPHEVAALRPCASATPPRTFIEPAGDGAVFIEWHHPKHGIGCLTLRVGGAGMHMFEPWTDCSETRREQLFTIEPFDEQTGTRYRLRSVYAGLCVGLIGDSAVAGAEASQKPCTRMADQEFLIDLLPPT